MTPLRKINTPRLIMAISLVDQLVERFIFADFSEAEKRNYPNCPNMVGFGRGLFHDLAITQKVRAISARVGLGPTASDVSGWERRVSPEMTALIPEILEQTCENPHPTWRRLADIWAVLSSHPVYVVDTNLLVQETPGMMPSGTYMTSFGNGMMRLLYVFAAGGKEGVVLGDDCIEWHEDPEKLKALYNEWGLETREVETFPADGVTFTFCSKFYDSTNEVKPLVVPLSWGKILANFANLTKRTPDQLSALYSELEGLPAELYHDIIEWAESRAYILPAGVE